MSEEVERLHAFLKAKTEENIELLEYIDELEQKIEGYRLQLIRKSSKDYSRERPSEEEDYYRSEEEDETDENGEPYVADVATLQEKYRCLKGRHAQERASRMEALRVIQQLKRAMIAQLQYVYEGLDPRESLSNSQVTALPPYPPLPIERSSLSTTKGKNRGPPIIVRVNLD